MAKSQDCLFLPPPRILTRGRFSLLAFLATLFVASFTQADTYNDGDTLPDSITSNVTFNFNQPQSYSGIISGTGITVTKTGTGTLTLSGANTYTGTTTINGGGLTLTDGGAIAGSDITVGSNSAANMTIESGAMVTSYGAIYIGLDNGSNGTLNITGGTVNAYWLRPGRNTGSTGVINISGGEVTISKPSGVSGYDESEIGNYGSGKITVSGTGKLTFTGSARIANWGQAESYINIEDYGEVTINTLYVGQRGSNLGTMTLSDHAKLTLNNGLYIGTNSGSKGSGAMTLKDNASVTLFGSDTRSYIGYDGGTSTLNVSDNATFTAQGLGLLVGNTATGVINQTGGTITLKPEGSVFLADGGGGKANLNISGGKFNIEKTLIAGTRGAATINLSGTGEINADATVVLAPGYETGSSSTVNQTGGTFNANSGIVYGNYFANCGTGVYNLSGGTLNTTSITYGSQTPSSAQFNLSGNGVANLSGTLAVPTTISGGTLNANAISIPSGKALTISGGTVNLGEGGITAAGTYTFNLSGGTFSTNNANWSTDINATMADNSTVTFAPKAEKTIIWGGDIYGGAGGKFVKDGEGTLTLSKAPQFTASTTVAAGTLALSAGGTLYNLSGASLDGNGNVVAFIDASGQDLTLTNNQMSQFIGSITAKDIVVNVDEEAALKIYTGANGKVDAQSLTVSSGRVDVKGAMDTQLQIGDDNSANGIGIFSPGNSTGNVTVDGDVTVNSDGKLLLEIDDFVDCLTVVNGDFINNGLIELAWKSGLPSGSKYILITADSLTGINVDEISVDFAQPMQDWYDNGYVQALLEGNNFVLTIDHNAIPEPSTWALLVLGVTGLLYVRKRKN